MLAADNEIASDCRLINRALRERWPVPEAVRERIVNRLVKIIDTEGSEPKSDKNAIAAASVIVRMVGQNQKEQPATSMVEHHHVHELGPITADNLEFHRQRLARRVAQLGQNSAGPAGPGRVAE